MTIILTQNPLYQTELCKLFAFKAGKACYRKNYIKWDDIERANKKKNAVHKKSSLISSVANKLLPAIIAKLERGERVILNHKYISKITLCKRRQNQRIIQQLESVLNVTYHNSVTHNGKKYRYSYEFSYKPQNQENTSSIEHSVETKMSRHTIYIENKNIEYIDLGSNSYKNSKIENLTHIPPKAPKVNKKRLSNQRKKLTNAEVKAKTIRFNQYATPRSLGEHYPLCKEDCAKLQSLSGRDFTINAMNEILKSMSLRVPRLFPSHAAFMAYYGKCLHNEKRDAVKSSLNNFRIKANITQRDKIEAKIEAFLKKLED